MGMEALPQAPSINTRSVLQSCEMNPMITFINLTKLKKMGTTPVTSKKEGDTKFAESFLAAQPQKQIFLTLTSHSSPLNPQTSEFPYQPIF